MGLAGGWSQTSDSPESPNKSHQNGALTHTDTKKHKGEKKVTKQQVILPFCINYTESPCLYRPNITCCAITDNHADIKHLLSIKIWHGLLSHMAVKLRVHVLTSYESNSGRVAVVLRQAFIPLGVLLCPDAPRLWSFYGMTAGASSLQKKTSERRSLLPSAWQLHRLSWMIIRMLRLLCCWDLSSKVKSEKNHSQFYICLPTSFLVNMVLKTLTFHWIFVTMEECQNS